MAGSAQQLVQHEPPAFKTAEKLYQEEKSSGRMDILSGPVMTGSPRDIASLAGKLVQVMAACSHVQKKGVNTFHKYSYVMASDVMEALNKACVDQGVACIPRFTKTDEIQKTQRSGQIATLVTVAAEVYLIDSTTGASLVVKALGTGEDAGDKAVAKAQTMAIKYALMSLCLISSGDDPEGDSTIDEENSAPAKTTTCINCGKTTYFKKLADFDGAQVEVYVCPACKKETRKKAGQ